MKLLKLTYLLLLCVEICACSGPSSRLKQTTLSRAQANLISDQLVNAIEERYPLLQHKRVNRYVDNLGQYIIAHNSKMPPLPYEFKVLKTNEVLSFSTPSGIVYMSLGMLRLCDFEAQFAAAMAHELAHQRLGHTIQVWNERIENSQHDATYSLQQQNDWKNRLFGPTGLVFYGEGFEREADALALALLYNAGYDSRAMLSFLEKLKNAEEKEPKETAGMLSTHPETLKRINWVKVEANRLPPIRNAKLDGKTFSSLQVLLKAAAKKGVKIGRPVENESTNDGDSAEL